MLIVPAVVRVCDILPGTDYEYHSVTIKNCVRTSRATVDTVSELCTVRAFPCANNFLL